MIELINSKSNQCATSVALLFVCRVVFWLCLLAPAIASAQSQPGEAVATGVLRLSVKPKVNGKPKGLQRKRFYLIKGGLEANKTLVDRISQQSLLTRECFYRNAKASEAFINWLIEVDCESVYCRPIDEQFLTGPAAVPEFRDAYERSAKEYKTPQLGRLWLTTNLTDVIRDGFYRQKQAAIKALIGEAQNGASTRINSVMTDRNGTAYFTDLTPGPYLVSNLLPIEFGANSILWICEVKIVAGRNNLQFPNARNTCVVIEKPLPACNANKQTASTR